MKVEGPFGKCGLTGNLKYARSGFDVKLAFDDIHGKKSTGKLTGKIPSEDYFGFKIPQIELLLESPAYFEKIYLEADLFQPIINNDWDWCSKHTFKMTVAGLEIGATVELKLKDQIESKLELESQLTIAGTVAHFLHILIFCEKRKGIQQYFLRKNGKIGLKSVKNSHKISE